MKLESLHIGMIVRHPQHGLGNIKSLNEHTAEILFNDGLKTIAPEVAGLEPAETQVTVTGLTAPLAELVEQAARAVVRELGLEPADQFVELLGQRWQGGKLVMKPDDPAIQSKEVPLEVFFHKIVMIRNNLRVLEQKINSHEQLNDGEKVEMQQYITRCYGSLTTFNILFKSRADQFGGASA
jgi:hypothetical protein